MAEGQDPRDQQPSTTARSPRWGDRKRGLSRRATAIAGIAAELIIAVIATAVYTQFAARRTPSPAATKTNGVFTKVAVPKMNYTSSWGFTTAPDGSFWFSELSSQDQAIGRVTPDGTNTEYPIPTDNTVRRVYINGMAVGSDGNIWFSGSEGSDPTFTSYLRRMTPAGVFTTIPILATLGIGEMIAGPDGAIWFSGEETLNPSTLGAPGTYKYVIGRITMDGQITEYPILSQ
jgi:streptogramin lyase